MALFKVCRGQEANMPSTKTDGYAYFCTDTRNFYIDWADASGEINRVQINADCANKLRYENNEEYVEIEASDVASHIGNTENPHRVTVDQIGAVPTSRTINGKSLDDDITLGTGDVGVYFDPSLSVEGHAADAKATGDAIASLASKKAETKTLKGTFLTDGWSDSAPYTQEIFVDGVLSTDYPFVDIDLSNTNDASGVIDAWKLVGRCTVSADNIVIAYCYEEKPVLDIPIIFKVVR